jgi:hypothetical protein
VYDQPLTAAELQNALDRHARMTRPKDSSYEQKIREVGLVAIALVLAWVALGAAGVPAVGEFAAIHVAPYVDRFWPVAAVLVVLMEVAALVGDEYRFTVPLAVLLLVPMWMLALLVRVCVFVAGAAVLMTVPAVSAGLVLHLLGVSG